MEGRSRNKVLGSLEAFENVLDKYPSGIDKIELVFPQGTGRK